MGFGALEGKKDQYSPPELAAMTSRLFSLVDKIGMSALNVRPAVALVWIGGWYSW